MKDFVIRDRDTVTATAISKSRIQLPLISQYNTKYRVMIYNMSRAQAFHTVKKRNQPSANKSRVTLDILASSSPLLDAPFI